MTEEDEIEALDRVVELYEEKGVPLSQAEIKKRLKASEAHQEEV